MVNDLGALLQASQRLDVHFGARWASDERFDQVHVHLFVIDKVLAIDGEQYVALYQAASHCCCALDQAVCHLSCPIPTCHHT